MVHEPHHVETRVEGALHDPLIERHDVGQQAGRHKVGDGEPGDVHVRPKRAGEQRSSDPYPTFPYPRTPTPRRFKKDLKV